MCNFFPQGGQTSLQFLHFTSSHYNELSSITTIAGKPSTSPSRPVISLSQPRRNYQIVARFHVHSSHSSESLVTCKASLIISLPSSHSLSPPSFSLLFLFNCPSSPSLAALPPSRHSNTRRSQRTTSQTASRATNVSRARTTAQQTEVDHSITLRPRLHTLCAQRSKSPCLSPPNRWSTSLLLYVTLFLLNP